MSEIIKNQPSAALAPSSAVTPMELLEMAREQGAAIEVMERLFELNLRNEELRIRLEKEDARKAYYKAKAAFHAHHIIVRKDKKNKQYDNAPYVSLENLVATVTPYLSQHGLSAAWELKQETGQIFVTCRITHELGFSETVTMNAPPDPSGAKNVIQQIKSTVTYLKVCTFESACGLASAAGSLSDDGNGTNSTAEGMSSEDFSYFIESIEAARTLPELKEKYDRAYEAAQKVNDKGAVKAIIGAKDRRKKEVAA